MCNYATKPDLKNATGIDASKLASKYDLVTLKAEADKLDTEKLVKISNCFCWFKSNKWSSKIWCR